MSERERSLRESGVEEEREEGARRLRVSGSLLGCGKKKRGAKWHTVRAEQIRFSPFFTTEYESGI